MARRRPSVIVALAGAAALGGAGLALAQQSSDPIGQLLQQGAAPAAPAPGAAKPASPAKPPPKADAAPVATPSPTDAPDAAAKPDAPPEAAPAAAKVAAKPAADPAKRQRNGVAIIQALDKVTAETLRFEAPIGQPVRYKSLIFTVKSCETSAPDEAQPDSVAHVQIDSQPFAAMGKAPPPAKQVFRGWMFASSPGLQPFQHPIYDAWLIACRT
ncbi:DUF2155 domain-containing protein [Caulobacter sp. CCUG 60055]|uniref:DUF2155 domain-containing protein n=1 Tax=Caulobacter sp. CCUG 60055 TaxID=2100090 RepID=UPI001FA770C7